MQRYVVFRNTNPNSRGGADDFLCSVDTEEEIKIIIHALLNDKKEFNPITDWINVLDTRYMVVIDYNMLKQMYKNLFKEI